MIATNVLMSNESLWQLWKEVLVTRNVNIRLRSRLSEETLDKVM